MENVAYDIRSRIVSNKYRTSLNDTVRVCFYARVSTQHEAQINALSNQLEWYNSVLRDHPNWEKVDIYVDQGSSGTQAENRQGFMRMIHDAANNQFDLICTREVSRFARNTVDSLSYTKDFLEHERVNVYDRSQYEYVKGDFPPIIPEEKWNRVQALKSKKVVCINGENRGKAIPKDKWCRHLVCECGSSYKKYKWRTNQSGEECNGYQCRHQIRYRKKSFREKNGLDGTGYCDVPSICEWKLDFMAKNIQYRLWKDKKASVEELLRDVHDNYVIEEEVRNNEYQAEKLQRELERLRNRKSNLMDMRLDNMIAKPEYEMKYNAIVERMEEVEKELSMISHVQPVIEPVDVEKELGRIKEFLERVCDLEQKQLSDELIDSLVARITPTEEGVFKWYIQSEDYDMETTFDESNYVLYDKFTLTFEEAKQYRKSFGNFIRARQWKDLIVEVYVRNS